MKPSNQSWAVLCACIGLLCTNAEKSVRADFSYADFSSVAGLTLNGDAAQAGNVLRVAPAVDSQAGSAWFTTSKQHLTDGFDTTFTIRIAGGSGADGMAFVIQNDSSTSLGGGGSDLGYAGINSSLAIEFDTLGFFPESGNHISVQSRGTGVNSAEDRYSLRQVLPPVDLRDGQVHEIRVRYRPGVLLVFLDTYPAPMIAIPLDLQNVLGDNILDGSGDAWVGFTAGTGGLNDNHDVLSWNFVETNIALPTGACCLPKGCVETTAYDCLTINAGFFGGEGTDCNSVNCEGACCTSGSCSTELLGNCLVGGGTFLGVDLPCVPSSCLGACCDQIGECFVTDEADCVNNNSGTFHGSGTTCGPFPCSLPPLGACCDNNHECLQMNETDCANLPGVWYGLGTSCFDVNCFDPPPPFGACCQPGNTCVDSVAQIACEHFNGVYKGDGSLCATSDCSGTCDCQNAIPLTEGVIVSGSTVGQTPCDGGACTGSAPAVIYSVTTSVGGHLLAETCSFANFDTVISVYDGCPLNSAHEIACSTGNCGMGSQVFPCVLPGHTYYIRVGGVGGASGDFELLGFVLSAEIVEGPFQNPGNGHWYYVTSGGPWTWLETLANGKGGHLATINDAAENEWVRTTFAGASPMAIGINDATTEGTFAWISGQPVTYTNWASGQPDNFLDQDYGRMLTDGTWLDENNCDAGGGGGVLEVNTVMLPGIEAGPIVNPANCHTYYLTQPGTWIECQMKAQTLGGNLATINDAAENEYVRATLANFGGTPRTVWIGLNDVAVENTFVWADGSPVGYTNWNGGEPNNFGNEDYVLMVDPAAGTWNDAHGGLGLNSVIEVATNCVCTCTGDLTGDLAVRGDDIRMFITCFIAANGGAPTAGCQCADVNHDGMVTTADITAMANAALAGPGCAP